MALLGQAADGLTDAVEILCCLPVESMKFRMRRCGSRVCPFCLWGGRLPHKACLTGGAGPLSGQTLLHFCCLIGRSQPSGVRGLLWSSCILILVL